MHNLLQKYDHLAIPFLAAVTIAVVILGHTDRVGVRSGGGGKTHVIMMRGEAFIPRELTVQRGDTVIFRNDGARQYWPASNIHPSHQIYPEFDPKKGVAPGESWSFVAGKAGEWRFHDHLAPSVTGTLIVKGDRVVEDREAKIKRIVNEFEPTVDWEKRSMFDAADSEDELYYWVSKKSPEEVMRKLLSEATTRDCHQQAHIIGRISYEVYGADMFSRMETACHSGFMHGGMEAFLQEEGTANIEKRIFDLCSTFETAFSNFECLHGLGHGVMAAEDYDLPKALEVCKRLPTGYDQSSCYGGAFMENIIVSIGQGVTKAHETKWLNDDPRFPCNAVDQSDDVQYACYLMQTSRMLDLNGQSFEKIAPICRTVREDMIPTCFQSFGRDAAGRMVRDAKKTADICKAYAGTNMRDCIRGALYSIAEFWAEKPTRNPHEFCEQFEKGDSAYCFELYGAYVPSFFETKDPVPALCAKALLPYQREACLRGASM